MIKRLDVHGVRNLTAADTLSLARLNLFYGLNGSGKSSLLEAVHILGLGRSFRSPQARHYIQDGRPSCTVYAELDSGHALGIAKLMDGTHQLRRNGASINQLAEFAFDLPVQLIHPDGMDLLDGGSRPRRQLLDWLVFHVEHSFYGLWIRYQKALAQRNALLKLPAANDAEFQVWEAEMARTAQLIDGMRARTVEIWRQHLERVLPVLLPDIALRMEYNAGFAADRELAEQWRDTRFRDRERGHTQLGPHRADLRLKCDLGQVEAVLSRGQKKLLICALKLAQVAFLHAQDRRCVVLLDDLASELDAGARQRLLATLFDLQAQVLITSVEADQLWPLLQQLDSQAELFHVEQGKISPARYTPEETT